MNTDYGWTHVKTQCSLTTGPDLREQYASVCINDGGSMREFYEVPDDRNDFLGWVAETYDYEDTVYVTFPEQSPTDWSEWCLTTNPDTNTLEVNRA